MQPARSPATGALATGALAAGDGARFASAAAAAAFAASAASSTRIALPSETLSPTLTRTSFTTPADGDGISIVALSLSSVTSDCSTATVSPGFTRISTTSTLLKSPMSGTKTSCMAPMAYGGSGRGSRARSVSAGIDAVLHDRIGHHAAA